MSASAKFIIESEDRTKSGIDSARNNIKKLAEGVNVKNLTDALKDITSGIADVTENLKSYISEFADAEKATLSLNNAIQNSTNRYNLNKSVLDAHAEAIKQNTTFEDDLITQQQAVLVSFGLTQEQIIATTDAAVELASSGMMPLDTAIEALGKTFEGSVGPIGKTLPFLKNFTKEELEAGRAIAEVEKRFKGMADTYKNSTAGQMELAQRDIKGIKEMIGEGLSPMSGFITTLSELANFATPILATSGSIANVAVAVKNLGGTAAIINGITTGFSGMLNVLMGPAGLVMALGAFTIGIAQAIDKNYTEKMQDVTEMTKALVDDLKNFDNNKIQLTDDEQLKAVENLAKMYGITLQKLKEIGEQHGINLSLIKAQIVESSKPPASPTTSTSAFKDMDLSKAIKDSLSNLSKTWGADWNKQKTKIDKLYEYGIITEEEKLNQMDSLYREYMGNIAELGNYLTQEAKNNNEFFRRMFSEYSQYKIDKKDTSTTYTSTDLLQSGDLLSPGYGKDYPTTTYTAGNMGASGPAEETIKIINPEQYSNWGNLREIDDATSGISENEALGIFEKANASEMFTGITEGLKETFGGVIDTISGSVPFLGPIFEQLMQLENVVKILDWFGTMVEGLFSVIGPAINNALAPAVTILYQVGMVVGNALLPLLQMIGTWINIIVVALTPILDVLQAILNPVMSLVSFLLVVLTPIIQLAATIIAGVLSGVRYIAATIGWIVDWIKTLLANFGILIYNILDTIFNGKKAQQKYIEGPNLFAEYAKITKETAETIAKIWAVKYDTLYNDSQVKEFEVDLSGVYQANTPSPYSSEASYTGQRDITVNLTINSDVIMDGGGGFRELVVKIKNELKAVEALGY